MNKGMIRNGKVSQASSKSAFNVQINTTKLENQEKINNIILTENHFNDCTFKLTDYLNVVHQT